MCGSIETGAVFGNNVIQESAFDVEDFSSLSDADLLELAGKALNEQDQHRKDNAILYYQPVSEKSWLVHQSTAKITGISGGNRSSKTETAIAEMVMLCTGVMPERFRLDPVFRSKFRGPMRCRVVVESLLNTLWNVMLPKFQHWSWNGPDSPGGLKGHWGWIPKTSLFGHSWDKAFSKELRTIRILCRDPDNPARILGESSISFMSKDNDPEDFASGEFHMIIEDEPPTFAIHEENMVRVRSVNGRVLLSMTWPTDAAIPVSWLYDDVYELGMPGPNKDPDIDWFELDSRDNPHQDMKGLEFDIRQYGKDSARFHVRIEGKPIKMASRVHPLFTDRNSRWCFDCVEERHVLDVTDPACAECSGRNTTVFNHVQEAGYQSDPIIYCLDPHPRKPHMMMWVAITPHDDFYQVAEECVDGSPSEVWEVVQETERKYSLKVVKRIMDPNMGASSPGLNRGVSWQAEFAKFGLMCDFADNSMIGQKTVNDYLQPDPDTFVPRIHVHPRCEVTIKQFRRFQWDSHKTGAEKGLKEKTKEVDDDFPALWRYCVNLNPNYRFLRMGAPVLGRKKMRRK